jgi:hypothetical protein
VCTSLFAHTCYMPRPSHSSRFDYPNNIWRWVQVIKLLVMSSSLHSPVASSLVGSHILSTLFSNTLSLCSFLSVRDQTVEYSRPYFGANQRNLENLASSSGGTIFLKTSSRTSFCHSSVGVFCHRFFVSFGKVSTSFMRSYGPLQKRHEHDAKPQFEKIMIIVICGI